MRYCSVPVCTTVVGLTLACSPASATFTTLFSSTPQQSLPSAQGWTFGQDAGGGATQSVVGLSESFLDTTSNKTTRAGWSHTGPVMDASQTFKLDLTFWVTGQNGGDSNNRSGSDVLLISHDATKAIELAYWNDRIFALNNDATFTVGESALIDTSVPRNYFLAVEGTTYTLLINSGAVLAPILSGSLRDYTASAIKLPGSTTINMYQTPDSIFLGDNSDLALADTHLRSVVFDDNVPAPEPATLSLLTLGTLTLLRRRR